jgi:predicted phosphodiesterase
MRIAVLSDIHGNLPALQAVLDKVKPFDRIWQLGDIVGYGPQPNEVIELLVSENAVGVRGNHDSAAIGELETDAFNDDARAAVEWTADQLTATSRAWLTSLPLRTELDGFTLVHGSPRDPTWEYVYTASIARANMGLFSTTHCLVGHTHVPLIYWQAGGRVQGSLPSHGTSLELNSQSSKDARKSIVNPGSVGQPRDGDRRACAMMLDTETMTVEWHRIDYPIEPVQELMTQARLPERLIARLSYGL